MDFGAFGELPKTKEANKSELERNNNRDTNMKQQNVVKHRLEHPNVYCDVCNEDVQGFRFKCLQCKNYDLCRSCELKGHHAGHILMRICFPEQAVEANQFFRYHNLMKMTGMNEAKAIRYGLKGKGKKHKICEETDEVSDVEAENVRSAPDESMFTWLPNHMGRRNCNKWSKCVGKMARKSAQTLASAATAAANVPRNQNAENNDERNTNTDLGAAAMQIQGLLDAFAIPVDVVSLHRQSVAAGFSPAAKTKKQDASTTCEPKPNGAGTSKNGVEKKEENGTDAVLENASGDIASKVAKIDLSCDDDNMPSCSEKKNEACTNSKGNDKTKNIEEKGESVISNPSDGWTLLDARDSKSGEDDANTAVLIEDCPSDDEMTVIHQDTLNKLLAMGFSNADKKLTAMIIESGGDIDMVLNKLFQTKQ